MEFKYIPPSRNVPDSSLLDDLKRVSQILGNTAISKVDYDKNGKYTSNTIIYRFSSWNKALELAGIKIKKIQILTNDEIIDDLKTVAIKLDKNSLTQEEYNFHGKYSASAVRNHFTSWSIALKEAGLNESRTYGVTNEEYFENIELIWRHLGRQPKYKEIKTPLSKYSAGAYYRRFGSFHKALESFIQHINDQSKYDNENIDNPVLHSNLFENEAQIHKTIRNVNYRLRFKIMHRDNFKCKKCGRSPATDPNVVLHIDHIMPYSKGGETIPDNLETLCDKYNLGKSDLILD